MKKAFRTQITVKKLSLVLVLACFLSLIIPADSILNGSYIHDAEARKSRKYHKAKVIKPKSKGKKTLADFMEEQQTTGKWAAIVVDANRGSIVYEKNAESKRYPASLTKMMTLYLLFDALDRKKVRLSTRMRASKRAAAQPQTNVSLKKGDTISVKQAIEALIIRSANDVALVVAEKIGGSQRGFARKMNRKAKELGMVRTNFVNPHGLPNSKQVTTAMDMAKLAIAIKRDFPHYYSNFSKTSFRFKGKTFKSHNRVIGRLPGADGLKTGYIRASGFNLATSMSRGNNRLVGVIMGGITGASRDQEMIDMLDKTLVIVQKKEEEERIAAAKRAEEERIAAIERAKQEKILAEKAREEKERLAQLKQVRAEEERIASLSTAERKQFEQLLEAPAPQRRPYNRSSPYLAGKNWAVQVGAFPTMEQARRAAESARRVAPSSLSSAQMDISQVAKGDQIFNRSRMLYLSAEQARMACDQLARVRKQCMVIRMEN